MKNFWNLILISFLSILINCRSTSIKDSKNNYSNYANDTVNLYAFIGEKISIEKFIPNINNEVRESSIDEETGDSVEIVKKKYVMDNAFRCKYKVIKSIFNHFPNDTIEFIAYDHYGTPLFSKKDSVILYISKNEKDNNYFHQKYQFDDVFKDNVGNYFSYPKFNNIEDVQYAIKNIRGFNINLKNEKISLKNLNTDVSRVYYPKEFYKIKKNYAIPVKGIYLDVLLKYRLNTIFKNL